MKYSLFCLLALLTYTLAVPLRPNTTEFQSNLDVSKKDRRTIGGTSTTIQHLPWNLSFRQGGRHICGASLISANRALTAATCFRGWDEQFEYSVLANSTIRTQNPNGVVVGITRFVRNPLHDLQSHTFNIGVAYLAKTLIFGPGMRAIAIPRPGATILYGANAIVSGWAENDVLQTATIPLIRNEACDVHYPNRITPDMVCAGTPGRAGCSLGAPLVAHGFLVGVYSFSNGCRGEAPGVYSRLSYVHNANFIRDHLIV